MTTAPDIAAPTADRQGPPPATDTLADRLGWMQIDDAERMRPFFMTVVSASDLWLYVSSRGGLTAGRCEPEQCLFPYETDDRIHLAGGQVGPVTRLTVQGAASDDAVVWRPFLPPADGPVASESIRKSLLGHRLVFESTHPELGLSFSYEWTAAQHLGWVRACTLKNTTDAPVRVRVVDGLRSIIPAGVSLRMQQAYSCLINAYRRAQVTEQGLGLYYLETAPSDLAQPSESLRCNTVWHAGLPGAQVRLAEGSDAHDRKGQVADYLLDAVVELAPGESQRWWIVADVHRSQAQAVALDERLAAGGDPVGDIERACADNARALLARLAPADALQKTGRSADSAQHLASVLYNTLRGGVPADQHRAPEADVRAFLHNRKRSGEALAHLHEADAQGQIDCVQWLERADASGDPDALRLALEYLPITFGRRHGDPSRPWNVFTIRLTHDDGSPRLDYQGNWRDVFQNWEAMALSFPRLLDRMIARFVNASTVDGFNPYRLTRDGFDWETIEPDAPWANIGYWGDHQIIYLLKLLEWQHRFDPDRLRSMLTRRAFAFADVPYRLKPYADVVADPRVTVAYDAAAEQRLQQRVAQLGNDGQLRPAGDGGVEHVTLAEKLLIPVLAKLSCFVPDGGIWMNTQRPEWNDANNALAGYGLSMVTLGYLRRHLAFLADRFEELRDEKLELSQPVAQWFDGLLGVLDRHADTALQSDAAMADTVRRAVVDALGQAFETYRQSAYDKPMTPGPARKASDIANCLARVLPWLDRAVRLNRRDDGLYHGYNLIRIAPGTDTAGIERLGLMLEGQVAALSAGVLTPDQVCAAVDALFESPLYRPDQGSFLLYPNRELPGFLAKNQVQSDQARGVPLLSAMLDAGEAALVETDADGVCRFNADFHNAGDLSAALDALADDPQWSDAVLRDRQAVLDLYEQAFHHHAFTGRSGGMYGFEGLGCIYWHMSSKLLLAVQECWLAALERGAPADQVQALAERYQRIRRGVDGTKTPEQYGAFPTDPYSHTPAHAGAQQPGMTGQVKEQILARWAELGVLIRGGTVGFDLGRVHPREYLDEAADWSYLDLHGREQTLRLEPGSLGMTLFQTPVILHRPAQDAGAKPGVEVLHDDGRVTRIDGFTLPADVSARLFNRDGLVKLIRVYG
ncbi:MAG: hypothetical protein AAF288_03500 [Planctomycetota bacterium]